MKTHYASVLSVGSLLPLFLSAGCAFDEGLVIENMRGKVYIPEAAATRELVREDGSVDVVTDVALIGPVYLGLYASVRPPGEIEGYAHPEVGPQYIDGTPGDTYPYGGTTIGDLRYACFEYFQCKLTSGRYVDFDDLVSWFNDTLQLEITDAAGNTVGSGEFVRQTCYALLDVTTDAEVNVTATKDLNEDGKLDEMDLDFRPTGDGFYEADFTIWQQEYLQDFSLWGFMDAPSSLSYIFSTCDPEQGVQENEYTSNFFGGRVHPDVLNQPAQYITEGDWVVTEGFVWKDVQDVPELYIDFEVL